MSKSSISFALIVAPASAFLSGYLFNFGLFLSFEASYFSALTIQDHITASLRWTSIIMAMLASAGYQTILMVPPSIWFPSIFRETKRSFKSSRMIAFAALATSMIVTSLAIYAAVSHNIMAPPNERLFSLSLWLIVAGLITGSLSVVVVLFVKKFSFHAPTMAQRLESTPIFIGTAIALVLAGSTLMFGTLRAASILDRDRPTHSLELQDGNYEFIAIIQLTERGVVGYRLSDKATLLIPWSEIREVKSLEFPTGWDL